MPKTLYAILIDLSKNENNNFNFSFYFPDRTFKSPDKYLFRRLSGIKIHSSKDTLL
ncbi:hypothetical protein SAMN04487894_1386 [Niabella drilacis]|uniref:Uncharacterized protein n=1 Tax=Niabella drilacis (strain DSM 25811 / CCM 8410 / CCUG 62505 / LMG 26954 / E90) TaxID=1285928 RepID=A0A1G7C446_NIADE|nr:hypothetical protein SAMN04487894_1386 [Niabella drilacis]